MCFGDLGSVHQQSANPTQSGNIVVNSSTKESKWLLAGGLVLAACKRRAFPRCGLGDGRVWGCCCLDEPLSICSRTACVVGLHIDGSAGREHLADLQMTRMPGILLMASLCVCIKTVICCTPRLSSTDSRAHADPSDLTMQLSDQARPDSPKPGEMRQAKGATGAVGRANLIQLLSCHQMF